jgi:hypothetical protein
MRGFFCFLCICILSPFCTSYIKFVYFLCRMVVLLNLKSLNFFANNEIILFFLYIWIVIGFLVLPIISGCTARVQWLYFSPSSIWTSSRMMRLFYFLVHSGFFGFLVLPTISGCTARVEWLYFSLSSIWTSSRMTGLFYFFTFEICRFSCTSYNKWLYCSCCMVVLLIIKYFNFLMNDGIILFFCTFYIKWVYCAEWLYFLPSSIWTSPQMMGLFYFFYICFLSVFLYFLY